jgi:hypothetical protein
MRNLLAFLILFSSCGGNSQVKESQKMDKEWIDTTARASIDTSRKNVILENFFQGEEYLRGFKMGQSCCDYSVQNLDGTLRFEVRKSDQAVSNSVRSEVTGKGYSNEERWYGFRVRLEDWVADNAGESIIQWHPNDSKGSANLSIWASGGMYTLVVSPHGMDNRYYELAAVEPNDTVDFVIHVKWTKNEDGFVEIWKDGKYITNTLNGKSLPYKGITTWAGCYLKLGINKWGWSYEPARSESTSAKRVLYYDVFREGNEHSSYKDVAP